MFISWRVTDWLQIQKKTNRGKGETENRGNKGKGETAKRGAATRKKIYPLNINRLAWLDREFLGSKRLQGDFHYANIKIDEQNIRESTAAYRPDPDLWSSDFLRRKG